MPAARWSFVKPDMVQRISLCTIYAGQAQGLVIKNTATQLQIAACVATTQSGIPTHQDTPTPAVMVQIAQPLALRPTAPRSCHA